MDSKKLAARVPFFRQLQPVELERILPHLDSRTLNRGDQVWFEGELGDTFAFLVRGRIKFAKTTMAGRDAITQLSSVMEADGRNMR